jgi:hypothetical protein
MAQQSQNGRVQPSENGRHGLRHAGDDAFQLTVDYLRQETVQPLKGLGRFLYMGIAGSFFLAAGILLILIGVLRLLQTETGTALHGNWSWVPYAVVLVLGLAVMGVAVWRITAGPAKARRPDGAPPAPAETPATAAAETPATAAAETPPSTQEETS